MKKEVKEKLIPNQNLFIEIKPLKEEDLPKFIEETLSKLGITLGDLAILLSTTERTCRRWLNGESDVSGQAITKIYKLRESYPEVFDNDSITSISRNNNNINISTEVKEIIKELGTQQSSLIKQFQGSLGIAGIRHIYT